MRNNESVTVEINTFSIQKLGNEPKEYEDAFSFDQVKKKLALADGASESCFSKLWADTLTRAFVKSDLSLFSFKDFPKIELKLELQQFVFSAQEEWNKGIDWNGLPWYVEEKARRGAFATFLGLELNMNYRANGKSIEWRALSVGDCCLFQSDNHNNLISSFRLTESAQFGNTPELISSKSRLDLFSDGKVCFGEGIVQTNERLIVASDAAAKWILQEVEAYGQLPKQLPFSNDAEARFIFEELIRDNKMRNDDVTLLVVVFR